jgi:phasin family protein
MATTPKKPTTPKAKAAALKPAAKPPVAAKAAAPIAKPAAPKPTEPEAPKLPFSQPVAAEAPKPVIVQPAVVETSTPALQPVAAEAPKPVPVIIAEPVPATAPTKLSVVPPASLPVPIKKLGSAVMGYEDLTAFGKDSFDALVKANALFAKGLEDFGREVLDIARTHMEEATKLATGMLQAKTLHEIVEMHTELTKNSLEKLVAESSALSELGMKVTNEALAPLNAQMSKAVEKMRELAAA